jgi:cytochrome c553
VKKTTLIAAAVAIIMTHQAPAADLSDAQKMASDVCEKCHGPRGTSASSLFPRLAGQTMAYLDTQLKSFRDKSRADSHASAYMWGIAGALSDHQIGELAAFYSALPAAIGIPVDDKSLVKAGKAIYEEGVASRDVPSCVGCHGEKAEGTEAFPRLAGQHYQYLVRQLQAFRGLQRENAIMDENAKSLSDDDIVAVASYLSSL